MNCTKHNDFIYQRNKCEMSGLLIKRDELQLNVGNEARPTDNMQENVESINKELMDLVQDMDVVTLIQSRPLHCIWDMTI